ncbi:hypothetical protein ELQ92_00575 [Labedella populi]|uniref:ParB/Sulfiredoxin domain-containing protein n=1 Tax=Labedella populi TaxID=2498850 RepID=A0A3S3ZYQ0_9MICO|nr:hypothetical protein [Labedella populi]RWZ67805.1 hypothetical protein ELQ92_00575 [Labedella populi]
MSEPLIAVPHGDSFRVIEGNRRLTALKGLADPDLRASFAKENKGWKKLPPARLPDTLPVLVVDDESTVAPLLGFRHISGIEPWDPHAQARYIARLVGEQSQDLDYVANLVGRSSTEVKAMYRDYDILEQADHEFGLDTSRARSAFGVFSNAMSRRAVQAYIGAKAPRYTDPNYYPVPDERRDQVEQLLLWIFGGPKGEGKVITDSRQLGDLAKALGHAGATEVLERTGVLSDALEAMADVADQFSTSVGRINRELTKIAALEQEEISEALWSGLRSDLETHIGSIESLRKGQGQGQ